MKMSDPTFQELLSPGADGIPAIANREFSNVRFSDFRLPGPAGAANLTRVKFIDCEISPATCQIDGGTTLREVSFVNFSCGDAIHVASDVFLDRVVFAGHEQPRMIWVMTPARQVVPPDYNDVEWCLDIRDYHGEVSIAGPPAAKILRDPQRHILFDNNKLADINWAGLGINALSYWKILAKKSRGSGAETCIFSTPSPSGRNYERSMKELKILRDEGLLS